jgi:hypothetical protein
LTDRGLVAALEILALHVCLQPPGRGTRVYAKLGLD